MLLGACAGTGKALAPPLAFTLPQLDSSIPYVLESDRGHVVLLDVWATWCEPCRETLPEYQKLAERYRARGLRVWALNVDEHSADIGPFLSTLALSLPVLLDPNATVAEGVLHTRVMPTVYLLDRQGRVRRVHEGVSRDFAAVYPAEIEALLAESAHAPSVSRVH